MLVSMTRREVRTQLAALLGMSTGTLAAKAQPQLDAWITMAWNRVLVDSRWISTRRRTTTTVATDQTLIARPAGAGIGGIRQLAVWDEDRQEYLVMQNREIAAWEDVSPLNEAGGPTDESYRARPQVWQETADGIEIAMPPDQEYRIRIDWTLSVAPLGDDASLIVDGLMVQLAAYADALREQQQTNMADRQEVAYAERAKALRGWSAGGEASVYGVSIADEVEILDQRPIPNWDRRPTVRP